jgi:hypothetical protein
MEIISMTDIHDSLEHIRNNRINPLDIHKIDAEFKVTVTDFLNEQRALLDTQKKYAKWMLIFSFTIMVATVIYAIFAVLQYLKM